MKLKITFLLLFLSLALTAQEKYYTKSGKISFESSVPTFEEVKATNTKVTAVFKSSTGEIAALALVKGFRFKIALMEEHFNENYAESSKFPKAKFSGKILNYSPDILKNDSSIKIKGSLTFHGITNVIEIPAKVEIKNGTILLLAKFTLKPEDFGIKIPKIVRKKIAERVDVNLQFELKAK
jgi:polyisoprenoid-binding protein YceI